MSIPENADPAAKTPGILQHLPSRQNFGKGLSIALPVITIVGALLCLYANGGHVMGFVNPIAAKVSHVNALMLLTVGLTAFTIALALLTRGSPKTVKTPDGGGGGARSDGAGSDGGGGARSDGAGSDGGGGARSDGAGSGS